MRKIKTTERPEYYPFYLTDGDNLLEIERQFDEFVSKTKVFPETVEVQVVGYNDISYQLVGIREETVPERARRETAERRRKVAAGERKKAKEAEERKEYERLKKKFGE